MLRVVALAAVATLAAADVCHLYSTTIESPCFESVKNGTDYSIRTYGKDKPEFFTNALILDDEFAKAQQDGFYANFDYISGKNDKATHIPMTAPVIFRKAQPTGFEVGFFVPSKFETRDTIPEPTNPNITIATLSEVKFAVSVFSGFAKETDFVRNEAALRLTLAEDNIKVAKGSEWSSVWAGYDSPFVLVGRHNEVWVQLLD